jgi:membrane-bound lytic murein transglycosylase B
LPIRSGGPDAGGRAIRGIAADCGNDAARLQRLAGRFKARAAAEGISATAISSALAGVSYDPTVSGSTPLAALLQASFEEFYARRVGAR